MHLTYCQINVIAFLINLCSVSFLYYCWFEFLFSSHGKLLLLCYFINKVIPCSKTYQLETTWQIHFHHSQIFGLKKLFLHSISRRCQFYCCCEFCCLTHLLTNNVNGLIIFWPLPGSLMLHRKVVPSHEACHQMPWPKTSLVLIDFGRKWQSQWLIAVVTVDTQTPLAPYEERAMPHGHQASSHNTIPAPSPHHLSTLWTCQAAREVGQEHSVLLKCCGCSRPSLLSSLKNSQHKQK